MNDLERYFNQNDKRLIHKWIHYFDVYDRHFSRFRGQEITILEIGVFHGGSLQMWKDYFGDKAKIYGIDINPECKALEEENIEIFIGSQSDAKFLKEVKKKIPKVDILIDDGGHTMEQQIVTFEVLFDHVKDNGVYLCEDLHTSYWPKYGGGYKNEASFIEYSKNFIDYLNAYHSKDRKLGVSDFTKTVDSIHYYDSILVLEKKKRGKPYDKQTGSPSYELPKEQKKALQKRKNKPGESKGSGFFKKLFGK
ncbi:class I SAM-dependent methyltransferase [Pararhodonellum marinum]|uniref:class I SAM-dependent methyltransferase n=1 Tax=Pararhodonellum marinum TaxID=2755358 RepID=UPI00188E2F3F|nr:class I SAM-dependent methyltransferase [Pararhodonellum marinum]